MHLHLCQTGFLQIQDFFQSFSKTIIFFPDSRLSNRWSTDTLKTQQQSFFHDVLETYGHGMGLNKIWPKQKESRLLAIFSRPNLHFRAFFRVWKIAVQISRFFREFKTLHEPWPKLVAWKWDWWLQWLEVFSPLCIIICVSPSHIRFYFNGSKF